MRTITFAFEDCYQEQINIKNGMEKFIWIFSSSFCNHFRNLQLIFRIWVFRLDGIELWIHWCCVNDRLSMARHPELVSGSDQLGDTETSSARRCDKSSFT